MIKRHELTLPKKELDWTNLCDVQGANAEPVFLAFREHETLENLIAEIIKEEPYSSVVTDDEFEHKLWLANWEQSDKIVEEFKGVSELYICDGHHRTAAAYNVGKWRREEAKSQGQEITGNENFNFFMSLVYPAKQLKILDYNWVLKTLNGMTSEEFMEKLSQYYSIDSLQEGDSRSP